MKNLKIKILRQKRINTSENFDQITEILTKFKNFNQIEPLWPPGRAKNCTYGGKWSEALVNTISLWALLISNIFTPFRAHLPSTWAKCHWQPWLFWVKKAHLIFFEGEMLTKWGWMVMNGKLTILWVHYNFKLASKHYDKSTKKFLARVSRGGRLTSLDASFARCFAFWRTSSKTRQIRNIP